MPFFCSESATGRVVKTAVREALEEFTSSLLQQDRMDNPWGSVLENLKSLFVSRSVQKDTAVCIQEQLKWSYYWSH